MRFQFIRLFFDAAPNPTPGGGNPTPTPAPAPNPNPAPQPAPDPKPDAALEVKIKALEDKIAALTKPEPTPAPTPAPKADDVPAWAAKLFEPITKQLETLQTEKTVSVRKSLLETELKSIEGLSDAYRDEVIDNFNGRTFENDAAFDTFKKTKVEAAKKIAQADAVNAISVFSAPKVNAGAGGSKVSSAMTDYLKTKNPTASKN